MSIPASKSFEMIEVVPFTELLHKPGGSFHKGGPIWPDWDNPGLERHWHRTTTIDALPNHSKAATLSDRKDLFWGGAICTHFGHQIMDFSMRILSSHAVDPQCALLFAGLGPSSPSWFFDIMDWFEVPASKLVVLDRATVFPLLRVVPQEERREQVGPSDQHLDRMDRLILAKGMTAKGSGPALYVSRGGQKIRFAGEAYLEQVITAVGGLVIRPENWPLRDQMAAIMGSGHVIFSEGSAMHLTSLAGRSFGTIDVLGRRPETKVGQAFLGPRATHLRYIELARGLVWGLKPSGHHNQTRGLPFYDEGKLLDYFAEVGINLRRKWNSDAFREAEMVDAGIWAEREITQKSLAVEGHFGSILATANSIIATEGGDLSPIIVLVEAARKRLEA